MARLSELPRRPPPKRPWKPWLWPLLLLGTGFVLGHYFHHENDEKEGVPSAPEGIVARTKQSDTERQ